MSKPVVLIAEELSPATVEALGPDFEIRNCNGADRAELLPAIADVDAILVRSATKVDAEALAAAKRLKVVARAGVGLDNVDVKAATQAGVMVVNAPTSNIVSAAELAVALMLAAARHVSPGPRRAEERRVEALEVHRHRALREDRRHRRPRPDRRPRRPAAERVRHERHRLRPLRPGRPRRADGRAPRRPRHPARRGRLHERPPAQDPRDGRPDRRRRSSPRPSRAWSWSTPPAAASSTRPRSTTPSRPAGSPPPGSTSSPREPCTDSPLFELENVVATPHLGASTDEAQEKAGVAVARSVRLALSGELVPDAVNVQGGVIAEDVRPGIPLTEKLGRVFTGARRRGRPADRRRGPRRDHRVRRQGARAGRPQGRLHRHRRGPGVLRERAAARGRARHRRTPRHRRREPRPPQPDHDPRHPRRRLAGLGQRHPDRHQPEGAAGRGQRLRRRHRAHRPPGVLHLRGPARAWSARSAGSSATPASTSPACRSPATPRAARRWSRCRSTRAIPAETLAEIETAIDADAVRAVNLT